MENQQNQEYRADPHDQQKPQKRKPALFRRFFRRFNPWLFLACLLLATVIWCAIMYVEDPNGVREAVSQASASARAYTL